MSNYMVVKTYKIYPGRSVSAEPMAELGGVQLRGWLREQGCGYEKVEQIIQRIDDSGSMSLQFPGSPDRSESK